MNNGLIKKSPSKGEACFSEETTESCMAEDSETPPEEDDTVLQCCCVKITCGGCVGLLCLAAILGITTLGVTLFILPYITS